MRKPITSPKGAPPKGPYSPAMLASGPTVYVSAQGPFDPQTGAIVAGDFQAQATQVFDNVTTLLEAAGASWATAVKVTVVLADFANFAAMNEVYARYVSAPYPARTTLESSVGAAAIVVDCIALAPGAKGE